VVGPGGGGNGQNGRDEKLEEVHFGEFDGLFQKRIVKRYDEWQTGFDRNTGF
jgi:broad specificity phosphatase PhoE